MLNINVGVLGHVDSGKTALAKALSTVSSTASFDKNPQSKERGITLDLGFSSFCIVDTDCNTNSQGAPLVTDDTTSQIETEAIAGKIQFTLVDCPGHASLIKTIIGGAQIIDLMMLVIDVTKGMQTQSAECLVIGQLTCDKMIVILNKIDLLSDATRQAAVDKMTKKIMKTLQSTKFTGSPIVPVAAKPGGQESEPPLGIASLLDLMKSTTHRVKRDPRGPFIYSVDHCFSIRGQGTVMTGTVLSGTVSLNDTVEIASMKQQKKVKSMQMFKRPVEKATQGDRVAICVTQFDPKLLERGLVSSPGVLPTIDAAIISANKISYFRGTIATKTKLHITMGHATVMARVSFFSCPSDVCVADDSFDFSADYLHEDELLGDAATRKTSAIKQFALLQFEKPITCPNHCLVIGSKLDADIYANSCRLAFHGHLLKPIIGVDYVEKVLPSLRVYKNKHKEAIVERKVDDQTIVCRGLFKKESKIEQFVGLKVSLSTGEAGMIEGGFGQSGKVRVRIPAGLSEATSKVLADKTKKRRGAEAAPPTDTVSTRVRLDFKRFIYDHSKKIRQT